MTRSVRLAAAMAHTAVILVPTLATGGLAGLAGDPVRLGVLVLAMAAGWIEAPMTGLRPVRPVPAGYRRSALASSLGLLAITWLALATPRVGTPCGALLGLSLGAAGVALRGAAIRRLGAGFVAGPGPVAAGGWAIDGPYRYLGHPSELGLLALGAGLALAAGSLAGVLVVGLVLAPAAAFRIRQESVAGR